MLFELEPLLKDVEKANKLRKTDLLFAFKSLVNRYQIVQEEAREQIRNISSSYTRTVQEKTELLTKENDLLKLDLKIKINQFKQKFTLSLLEVLDSLEIWLATEPNKIVSGIVERFYNIISSYNVSKMPVSVGESFDPNRHYPLYCEAAEQDKKGKVVKIIRNGFLLDDVVIRQTMVSLGE